MDTFFRFFVKTHFYSQSGRKITGFHFGEIAILQSLSYNHLNFETKFVLWLTIYSNNCLFFSKQLFNLLHQISEERKGCMSWIFQKSLNTQLYSCENYFDLSIRFYWFYQFFFKIFNFKLRTRIGHLLNNFDLVQQTVAEKNGVRADLWKRAIFLATGH